MVGESIFNCIIVAMRAMRAKRVGGIDIGLDMVMYTSVSTSRVEERMDCTRDRSTIDEETTYVLVHYSKECCIYDR